MSYPENTTQQLRYPGPGYPVEDSTTQANLHTQVSPDPASGRMPVATPTPAPAQAPAAGAGRGKTTIAEDVIERMIQKIVDLTVDEVEGVHGLRPGIDAFLQAAAQESDPESDPESEPPAEPTADLNRAVAVSLTDGQATISLSIEVDFGFAVHEVVEKVRATVISQAERLLGLTVAEVNVVVADVSFEDSSRS